MNKTTLIVISYNSHQTISSCLGKLLHYMKLPCIIIDNASTDGSAAKLETQFPNCEVIAMDKNLGYGRAANVALEKIETPYALLINPDIIVSPEQIDALINKAQKHQDSAIFAPATHPKHKTLGHSPLEQKDVSGSCMLFDMTKLKEVGFFDENIFLFSEETDLCRRAKNAGYQITLFPDVFVEHLAGTSSGENNTIEYLKNWHFGWSRSYFYHKHGLDTGKKALTRRLRMYRWKRLTARNNYQRVKYNGICAGIKAFQRGEKAFMADGQPQMNPNDSRNPYVKKGK